MFPAIFRVFLDTNVLFPSALRDTLLRAAETGLVQVYWSVDVLKELERNLVRAGRYDARGAARLIHAMREACPSAEARDYQHLIASMPNHPRDRHVVAAAQVVGAQVIVTNDLADFRALPGGMEAQDADAFLEGLFDLSPEALVQVLTRQAEDKEEPAARARPAPRRTGQAGSGLHCRGARLARRAAALKENHSPHLPHSPHQPLSPWERDGVRVPRAPGSPPSPA